jgi:hypothetical protein
VSFLCDGLISFESAWKGELKVILRSTEFNGVWLGFSPVRSNAEDYERAFCFPSR